MPRPRSCSPTRSPPRRSISCSRSGPPSCRPRAHPPGRPPARCSCPRRRCYPAPALPLTCRTRGLLPQPSSNIQTRSSSSSSSRCHRRGRHLIPDVQPLLLDLPSPLLLTQHPPITSNSNSMSSSSSSLARIMEASRSSSMPQQGQAPPIRGKQFSKASMQDSPHHWAPLPPTPDHPSTPPLRCKTLRQHCSPPHHRHQQQRPQQLRCLCTCRGTRGGGPPPRRACWQHPRHQPQGSLRDCRPARFKA